MPSGLNFGGGSFQMGGNLNQNLNQANNDEIPGGNQMFNYGNNFGGPGPQLENQNNNLGM